jgi:hypothetical protein
VAEVAAATGISPSDLLEQDYAMLATIRQILIDWQKEKGR